MAMMARMRSLAPAFILTVGALFVLFMVMSDSNVLEALGGKTNNVGSVNGEDISYNEYQTALERQREIQKQQTGKDIEDEQWDQFREQVWDALVTQKLLADEVDKLGISVTDDEVKDIILGENPPEFLKQNFIDSTGNFNRAMYEDAIFDPQNEQILLQAEEWVRQNRLNEKLQSMLLATITVSDEEVKRRFIEQNIYMDAQYALFPTTLFPDSLLKITDDDLQEYYEQNLGQFKIIPQRKLRFVLFRNQPSGTDTNMVIKDLENVKVIVQNDTAEFKTFVDIYSEVPYSMDTLEVSSFSPDAINLIRKSQKGDVIGPVPSPQGYTLYHLVNVLSSKDRFVRASHILISQLGDDAKNLEEANRIYQELTKGADFGQLARQYSKDPGSAQRGGDLGWFGKGMMVKEFEDACFNGKVGEIQKPVKTSFGYHIIKVTDQSTSKYIVEKIINPVKQSATTADENYNAANDFSYLAKKNDFTKEAEILGYTIQETPSFNEKSVSIPGLGANKRLITFSFESSLNDISDVHKLPSGYVVAQVSEVIQEGVQSFDEVKTRVKQLVVNETKYIKAKELADNVMKKASNDLNKVSTIDSRIQLVTTGRFNSQSVIPNVGKDYGFINTALSLEVSQVSKPFKAVRGYYVIKLTEKTPFDSSAFSIQSNTLKNTIMQEKKNAYLNNWLSMLKEEANIVDNRHLFYGY
jgi:parvulin-like peptidyl-prolyl isomerase